MATRLTPALLTHEVNSLRDPRWWLLLLVAIGFTAAGFTVDPASNCSEGGECAPFLVPIAAGLGLLMLVIALSHLTAATSRGSRIDLVSGDMAWWQNRTRRHTGDHGSYNLANVTRIMISRESERADELHVYDSTGVRLPYLDCETVPWRLEDWAGRVVAAWPHIALEIRD